MKKNRVLFLGLAGAMALLAFVLVSESASYASRRVGVVAASRRILAGSVIRPEDLQVLSLHPDAVPAGALRDPAEAVGKRALAERLPGDILVREALGEAQVFRLEKGEVAVAVSVDRVTGLSGLLRPGDRVSVIGVIPSASLPSAAPSPLPSGAAGPEPEPPTPYARLYLRGLRVLFVHHEFAYAPPPPPSAQSAGGLVPVSPSAQRQAESGVVVLAAPVDPIPISIYVGMREETRFISPAEALALINAVGRAHLALDPPEAAVSGGYGVRLIDLLPSVSATRTITTEVVP
jgi:Flp pilus assembly protein CpaB